MCPGRTIFIDFKSSGFYVIVFPQVWKECEQKVTKYFVEAGENAKFLNVIEKSSHAIYLEDPSHMKKSLFRLLHVVKMIYNISTFYNTPERIASLLVKITNVVIQSCRRYITDNGVANIWDQDPEIIEEKLTACIKLNQQYRDAYHEIRKRKEGREKKEFSFSEQYIFGRFDYFCTRLQNILNMFGKIKTNSQLFKSKFENLLAWDLIEDDQKYFEAAVKFLRMKEYDYLDFRNTQFDKDYSDFMTRMETLTERLRVELENAYEDIWGTPHSFQYIARFEKLSKLFPVGGLKEKYTRVIACFQEEMDGVIKIFKKLGNNKTPIARVYPDTAGKVYWVRSLLYHLKYFIDHFETNKSFHKLPEYKKIVKHYNDAGVLLMKYEILAQEAFKSFKIHQIEGMIARPIIRTDEGGMVAVNFDPILNNFLHENHRLCKLDIPLPTVNRFLIKRKPWFHEFKDMVDMTLAKYYTVVSSLNPDLKRLFYSHLHKIKTSLDPGMAEFNWTSYNWQEFTDQVLDDINRFGDVVKIANDIFNNRVEKTLQSITEMILYEFPTEDPWTLEYFLEKIKEKCVYAAVELQRKSLMIEEAIEDLIELAREENPRKKEEEEAEKDPYQDFLSVMDRHHCSNVSTAAKDLRKNFGGILSVKLTNLVKGSLRILAKYFNLNDTKSSKFKYFWLDELGPQPGETTFVLTTRLSIPEVEVYPSMEEVQNMLSVAGKIIISVTKGVRMWGKVPRRGVPGVVTSEDRAIAKLYNPIKIEKPLIEELTPSFYKVVSESKDVTKAFSILTTTLSNQKVELASFKTTWEKYSEIWINERDETIEEFMKKKPKLSDFEDVLYKYKLLKAQLAGEQEEVKVGKILVSCQEFIRTLNDEIQQWINTFANALYTKYVNETQFLISQIEDMDKKLDRPIKDLDDIRIIMETQKKIRDIDIDMDIKIKIVENAFTLIEKYDLPVTAEHKQETETLFLMWMALQTKSMDTMILLLTVQEHFQQNLKENLTLFQNECDNYCSNYHSDGPMQPGLTPKQASDMLAVFQTQFDTLWRKHSSYSVGEDLFGMDHTDQPGLMKIKKELNLLQRLYKLYNDVIDSVDGYYNILWVEINIEAINNELIEFGNRCRKLPRGLKEWPAFHALKKTIDDFNDICPLLELMSNKAMKFRHWQTIQNITKHTFNLEDPMFALKDVMEAPLVEHKEDIEDICMSAIKERDIESKLKTITAEWTCQELDFQTFKGRGELLLKGDVTADTVGQAEDSLMILGSLLSNRYNAPFKKQIQKWVTDLSNTTEILERWLLVQNLWVYLEAVFVGGDIAKQLPKEAKRFYKIDKTWQKIMNKAHETTGVINCCVGDEYLRQSLPILQGELETCQKSLTGYLEKKRLMFPRFFFVSDPVLLEILGQASDSHTIQSHLLSIFDNVASVKFHAQDYNKILSFSSSEGEVVELEKPVRAEGSVELWLNDLLRATQESVHGIIREAFHFINDNLIDLIEFTNKFQAQVGILGIQMIWTRDAEEALSNSRSDRKIMGETNNRFLDMLNTLIGQTTKELKKIERTKFETLITVHMHQRDIFDMLHRTNARGTWEFEWQKQARFYFKQDQEKTQISITDVNFTYQNEYLGCQDRLVITPLTDRCYVTLAQAMGMCKGGSPNGPAGTGKTETVKDMAKTLGKYNVVFNCSAEMDYKGLGRIYKGLAQSGSWGCFDEFNRIALPVLSVAAAQIAVVLSCKKDRRKQFVFTDGDLVDMNPEFGIFTTMNPTYAGRQDLPENVKIQFRNCAMMVPDRQMIIRVKLASCGFLENITLARKFFTLYKLCEEQLSKQKHYDFGLRNILSVLKTLGYTKRANPKTSETSIVMRVLRDMNISKLVDEDEPLFLSIINDLFPNLHLDKTSYPELDACIAKILQKEKLINHPTWHLKVIQLYESQNVRHGIMVLGPSGSGKTTCIKTLADALTMNGKPQKEFRLNPKSITDGQMFGKTDPATNDWTDGIFSALWRKSMKVKENESMWLVLDGPVDPNWIENLNSVMDENRILTLANGDRLPMASTVKLIFEPQNVDNASPATVSRCGMVYMSSSGLDWQPLLAAWLANKVTEKAMTIQIKQLFECSFNKVYKWSMNNLIFVTPALQVHILQAVFTLLEALLPSLQKKEEKEKTADEDSDEEEEVEKKPEVIKCDIHQTYIFCLIWAFGGYLENSDRDRLEAYMREKIQLQFPQLPRGESIFNFQVNTTTGKWSHWNTQLKNYVPPNISSQSYGNILIPNVSSIRTEFIINCTVKVAKNILIVGEQGSAKSTLMNSFLKKIKNDNLVIMHSNFSSTTTPHQFQKSVESNVDRRMGSVFGPPVGKNMIIFVDDVSQPEINKWGDQVTNEFFRSMMEMKGFYSLERPGEFHNILDIQYMTAMIHPGAGRNDIPQRVKRHFITQNLTIPTEEAIDKVFKTIAVGHFNANRGFTDGISNLIQQLVPVTRKMWKLTKEKMLPTPSKFHYVFNLRDLSRIWLGMIGTNSNIFDTEIKVIQLWRHEVTRVLADRFVNQSDKEWFNTEVVSLVKKELGQDYEDKVAEQKFFVDFMRDAPEPTGEDEHEEDLPRIYEPCDNFTVLIEKLKGFIDQYNDILRGASMDLVFFPDAIENLIKISRIIRNPGGNALLVGVGGSGKQSLTKLSAFIAGHRLFQITMTRTYNTSNFVEDLKNLYKSCGTQGTGTTFLFTDMDIKEESFLEYVNNLLAGGSILSLFSKDELQEIVGECLQIMKRVGSSLSPTRDNAIKWFTERVRLNLHVVLSFSPVGELFRSRALKFPGLISGCTINWFQPWPKSALIAVSSHFLKDFEMKCTQEIKQNLFKVMASIQDSVSGSCLSYFERFRRMTHVTPRSFLSFLNSYKEVYSKKEVEIGEMSRRMNAGLEKLLEASQTVEVMKEQLAKMEKELEVANQKAEKVLVDVTKRSKEAEVLKEEIIKEKSKAQDICDNIEVDRKDAEVNMLAAKPALDEAENALNTIKQSNIATVRKLGRPPHLIMRVMDCTMILFQSKLPVIKPDFSYPCPRPSWTEALKVMASSSFLSQLLHFPKDTINDETVELLEPYFVMEDYSMDVAKRVCSDVAGLLGWTKAMSAFYSVNKEVLPLKIQLAFQEARLNKADKVLQKIQRALKKKERELKKVQKMYHNAILEKQQIAKQADQCRKKMSAASTLINGLGGERVRWTQQSKNFKEQLQKLIGDSILACAFLSYSGPFNQEFRNKLMIKWKSILKDKSIPFNNSLGVVSMLVDAEEMAEWSLQGLPSDELSLQNAAIVTKARSYPLLVDPQGQGKIWLRTKEQYNEMLVTNLRHKYFRTHLEESLSLGRPLLIADVGEELDPVLDNLLERNFIKQGKNLKVMLGDREMDITDGFYLYITTKLPNPAYSPDISARCAIVDFTVTRQGLEDQLLGRVVKMEKAELEKERSKLAEDVMEMKSSMVELEDNLLKKLSAVQGSIVDDDELIKVLNTTKTTANTVSQKLKIAGETEIQINASREEYRSVAARGSILYFLIVEMSNVNRMYQTALRQFLVLYEDAILKSKPTHIIEKRIANIENYLTKSVWKYTSRGLYEKHKFLFTLLLALKIDLSTDAITYQEFLILLKGGAALDLNSVKVTVLNVNTLYVSIFLAKTI